MPLFMPASAIPLINAKFTLNTSGVTGFIGGDKAVLAMGTINLYRMQRWLGWYNSPGNYSVAKYYGKVATDRIWCTLFPGKRLSPSELFGLDGIPSPEFITTQTSNYMEHTNYPAHVFMELAIGVDVTKLSHDNHIDRSLHTRSTFITIAYLDADGVKDIDKGMLRQTSLICVFLVISFNLGACIACGVFEDWFCFAMILMGIVINEASCYAFRSAKLVFDRPRPSNASPPGDGILISNSELVILLGKAEVVGSLISGRLKLKYSEPDASDSKSKLNRLHITAIGICSLFQYMQSLIQLLLIPQGTLFGQTMFLSTLAVSWMYNFYLSYHGDKLDIQHELLMKVLGDPQIVRFELPSWITKIALALLVLKPKNPEKVLNRLMPHDTRIWKIWKREVLKRLKGGDYNFTLKEVDDLDKKHLLMYLYRMVESAYAIYEGKEFDRTRKVGHRPMSSACNKEVDA